MAFNKFADSYFSYLTIFCLVVFSLEVILKVMANKDYVWSFYFWLDLFSTSSLVFDIQEVSTVFSMGSSAASTVKLARAGRASRIGTK